jgi:hypothetical protein
MASSRPLSRGLSRDLSRPLSGGLVVDSSFLELYPGASLAYSLQDIGGGGNVIRARRSSDNAEADFGAADITGGSLASWAGGGDAFVTIWYDQTGNFRDATQTTASQQPKIVNSGSVVTDANGYPTLSFDEPSSQYFNVAYLGLYRNRNHAYWASIAKLDSTNAEGLHSALTALGNARFVLRSISGNWNIGGRRLDSDAFRNSNTTSSDTNIHLQSVELNFSDGNFEHYVDGSSVGSVSLASSGGASSDTDSTAVYIGRFGAGVFYGGTISEFVAYGSDQSSSRSAIESSIIGRYG